MPKSSKSEFSKGLAGIFDKVDDKTYIFDIRELHAWAENTDVVVMLP